MIYRTNKPVSIELASFTAEDRAKFDALWKSYLLWDGPTGDFQTQWQADLIDYSLGSSAAYDQHPLFVIYRDLIRNIEARFAGHHLSDMLFGFAASPFFAQPFAHPTRLKKSPKYCPLERTQLLFDPFYDQVRTVSCSACNAVYLASSSRQQMQDIACRQATILAGGTSRILHSPEVLKQILDIARQRGFLH